MSRIEDLRALAATCPRDRRAAFLPQSRAFALEPRILFDGAAAAAVEHQDTADASQAPAPEVAHPADPTPATPPQPPAPQALLVIDERVNGHESLAASAAPGTQVLIVRAQEDGVAAVSAALAQASEVDSVQILSHGAPGQLTLGTSTIRAGELAGQADALRDWGTYLAADADILLYGCSAGAGNPGQALMGGLAELTGADVAASTDDTGSSDAGGDWELEVAAGRIDSRLAVTDAGLAAYDGLLADASPTVALSAATMDTLLGDRLSFTATFTNTSTQPGFAPFMDLILPATGKDGAGVAVDDGITFVSATYLGQAVKSYVIAFDASGNATHPLAKNNAGQPVIVTAAAFGAQAGDQLVVLELPYASVIKDQPSIPVLVTCQLSDLADTEGSPDLTIAARGGFQYGNNSADNPTQDPSLIEAGVHNLVVHPTELTLTQTTDTPEGETATGPNFERSLTVTATPPPGQTLTNVEVTQVLPDSIRVTAITPGGGGTIKSITLRDGSTLSNPALIHAALQQSPYLTSYTVEYASLTTATAAVVSFYVPDKDFSGADVLNPSTGDNRTITLGQPTATGEWLPLDVRDQTLDPGPPVTVVPAAVSATGNDATFVAKAIALRKSVVIAGNAGSVGVSPGDTLQYTLNIDLSDYFAMGKTLLGSGNLTIADGLGDGQRMVPGSAAMTLYADGTTQVTPLLLTDGTPGTGGTALTFDLAQSLLDSGAAIGALIGDLASDGVVEGATRVVITYDSTVGQAYTAPYPQSEINEGDTLGNNATVSGTILENVILLTGNSQADSSAASITVPTHSVTTSILTVNGATPPTDVELKPGDIVTFKLSYDLETGDYEAFKLSAYLPLPLFNLAGIVFTPGIGIGTWAYGAGNTNTDPFAVDTVTVGPGNSVVFDFGNYETGNLAGSRIEVQFTLEVGNQPFADQRSLTVLGQSDQLTTVNHTPLISEGPVRIVSVAEPVLAIKHGVVAVGTGSGGVVTGTTGTWAAAGSGGAPFTGSVTDLAAVDGSVTSIDAGDLVRLATAIENTGGLGAFDVVTGVTLPAGLSFAGGSLAAANLAVYRGNGTRLVAGTDYAVSGTTISFLDHGGPSLLPGRVGTANDTSGANVLVITYDAVAAATVAASQSMLTTGALTNYSGVNGGPNFTPVELTDTATQSVAAPTIVKRFANGTITDDDSSAAHTTGANLVIGEGMLYDIVVTLPEGVTQSLRVNDLIPAGLTLDTGFGTNGYQLITTLAGSAALTADFAGAVAVGSSSAPGGDGADLGLTFSAATANADNNAGNNSFVVRVRLTASNVAANQAGRNIANSAALLYSDPDGDTPNGTAPVDRQVALGGSPPSIAIREPTLALTQTYLVNGGPPVNVVMDDVVTYTITLTNNAGNSDFAAFDIGLTDTLPVLMTYSGSGLGLLSVNTAGGATGNLTDFTISSGVLQTVGGANIDIPKGGSATLVVAGRVLAPAASVPGFSNTATVQWTSLDGAVGGERTGVDGLLNSGVLNDYRVDSTARVQVVADASLSHIGGLPDTPAPTPTTDQPQTVAVGEIIRYRVAARLTGGITLGSNFVITLPDGLSFINDGHTTVGLVGDSNSTLFWSGTTPLTASGNAFIAGGVTDREQSFLAADLSNSVTAVLNPARIDVSGAGVVTIAIGDLTNNENLDANAEAVYVEFNVRVANTPAVDTSDSFVVGATFSSSVATLTTTNTVVENVVEPNLSNVQKTVTDFDPRTSQATGIATVTVAFTNAGDGIAYDTHLVDSMVGGTNYALNAVIIDGRSYLPGSLPAGVTVSTSGGITADFSTLAVGASIRLIYRVEVPNDVIAPTTDAVLTWSSLPESFQSFAGSSVGVDDTATGERLYSAHEGAGLGIITGTLWDDTASATANTTPDGTGLAGQAVTLTWAGLDGNLATAADNRSFTVTTDTNGVYRFGVLPSGTYRIDTPNPVTGYVFGADTDNLAARIDTDAGTLATATIPALGEGSSAAANVGYVRQNDAPVNSLPPSQTTLEDTPLAITGISVTDVDAASGDLTMSLSVLHGTLNLNSAGVTVSGGALTTATVTLRGSQNALNAALATLIYTPAANYNGRDTLTVTTNDLGNFGDADGNLTPGQPSDALTDTDSLPINITPVNDAPIGTGDDLVAIEAGGRYNGIPGQPGLGNVLSNDSDVDILTNGDVLAVSKIGLGTAAPTVGLGSSGFTHVLGAYGELLINSQGATEYVVNENNADVQALRLTGNTLSETFTYELRDLDGLTSTATITTTIRGANDTPVGWDDEDTATEAGGVANGSGGSPAIGNVLTNDSDVDANAETRTVTGIRTGAESIPGNFVGVPGGGSTTLNGRHGTLTINSDGTYTYSVDQTDPDVERMVPGDTLTDRFSYTLTDALGANDVAQLTIRIQGANDNPVASDDRATAQAASTTNLNAQELNPTGNVILIQSRPGTINQQDGNGIDTDVDRTDQPNSNLRVDFVRTGTEAAGSGTAGAIGAALNGTYGSLTLNADGSYLYDVDSTNPTVRALQAGQSVTDVFTYRVVDTSSPTGLTDIAQLVVTVFGVNDPPVANDVYAVAVEAGGVANGTLGVDPTGDAKANDYDPDGDLLTVIAFRTGTEAAGAGTAGTLGSELRGTYGWLTLSANGAYSYRVDNTLPAVEALRTSGDTLSETFTYQIADNAAPQETDVGQIVITIEGRNDAPVARDDTATAREAGGVANGIAGVNPIGNVLTDLVTGDTDVDGPSYGETKAVTAVRTGAESDTGTTGTISSDLRGTYGWLRLNADGSYAYRVDNAMAAVQALRTSADTLTDLFTYTVLDAAGASDQAQLTVTIQGANDTPVPTNDTATAVEAGGVANGTPGIDPTGNVLTNDSDVDAGDGQAVTAFAAGSGSAGTLGNALAGTYGSLTLHADGSYGYAVDNANAAVQALRLSTDTLSEIFVYTMRDTAGATASATLTVTIQGVNDTPVTTNDTATAVEAGGVANGTPGIDPTGNVLTNDSDVDAGDAKAVSAFANSAGNPGTVGGALLGTYGSLTLNADGSYRYAVDNAKAAVQALRLSTDTLSETFVYTMRDRAGATASATLTVTIRGADDNPVANNDVNAAWPAFGGLPGRDPTGYVLSNDTDVDAGDSKTVTGIRTGTEGAGGGLTAVPAGSDSGSGQHIAGLFGDLIIGADGSYLYVVDPVRTAFLGPFDVVLDPFTYEVSDRLGLSDTAQLSILVRGRNDSPVAADDLVTAIEAGGVANGTPGIDPTGSAVLNDVDAEGDPLRITAVRTGAEAGSGTAGTVGAPLRGQYGTLTLRADGTYDYVIDNGMQPIEALRTPADTLTDRFAYTVSDIYGAEDQATIVVTIHGANDNPVATDDLGAAVEAGGVDNRTPGAPATGNVLDNDTDIDQYGETKIVAAVRAGPEAGGGAGTVNVPLRGAYGWLTLNADGSYRYLVDNGMSAIEALRTAADTLTDSFTYTVSDISGAADQTTIVVTIHGANDNPIAADDLGAALEVGRVDNRTPGAPATGNVLDNDTDIDRYGETMAVAAVRAGPEAGGGVGGTVGVPLKGAYGWLTLNEDGSYTYVVDDALLSFELLRPGQSVVDIFTYTVRDASGATDTAQLTLAIRGADDDTPQPNVPDDVVRYEGGKPEELEPYSARLGMQPALFVTRVVDSIQAAEDRAQPILQGFDVRKVAWPEMRCLSIGSGLGRDPTTFVHQSVVLSKTVALGHEMEVQARPGRLSLGVDGLLPAPTLFDHDTGVLGQAPLGEALPQGEPLAWRVAPPFSAQLRAAAAALRHRAG